MNDKYFLDTNIIVYAHDNANPQKQLSCQELIFQGMREDRAVISVQVLNEFIVTVTQKIEQKLSIPVARHIVMLLSHMEIVDLDYEILLRSMRIQENYGLSYWDGMIIAGAERSGCGILYSEDLSHGQMYYGIHCINPFKEYER